MHLVIDVDGVRREVELAQAADTATLTDVVRHVCDVALSPDDTLWVDDSRQRAGDLVGDVSLLEGSRIGRSRADHAEAIDGWAASLSGGMNAGRTVPVPRGRPLLIGRSPQADLTVDSPSVSWSHASVERDGDGLRIRDSGSTNGTMVDGVAVGDDGILITDLSVVVVGGAAVTLWQGRTESLAPAPGTLHNLTHSATVPFNRPPRAGLAPAPDPIEAPARKDPPPPARFGIAAIVAPLLMAVVMVMLMRDLRFALFALLSPVMAVGTTVEQKRRRKKDVKEADETFDKALTEFRADLESAAAIERERRRELAPDPALTLRRADLPTTRLWQRRPGSADFLILHAGIGNVDWDPPLSGSTSRKPEEEVQQTIDDAVLPAAPVEIDLTAAGVVGVIGDRDGCLAVARSLLCQAATHCGPADLTVGVFCDPGRAEEWSWAGWLPHTRRMGDGSGGRWLSTERGRSEGLLRAVRDGIDVHPTRAVLLLLDSDVLTEGRDAPARQLLGYGRPAERDRLAPDRPTVQVSGIVIAATEEQLPASCTTVIEVRRDAGGRVRRPGDRTSVDDVVLAGISVATARACAADLARFDDPELSIPGGVLPSLVRLPPLLGIDEVSPEAVRRTWAAATRVATPLGVGEHGVFGIDLVRDGPHGLVGGTTGSGKSEFLRSMVAGLAAQNDPTRLTFILIDFKGGAAFKTCERLPHTIGTVSNLDEQLADRALTALEAELRYRQEVFARAGEGIDNLDAYLATNPSEPMPRLLLVIDEFAMLAKDYPDVLKSLVSVAAVGRTLGVHMILATQRPAGVVNEDILANTNLRVALRVQSREDSVNVIGVPAASSIGRTQWGRAYVKLGQDDITPVQTALVTGRAEAQTSQLVDVHPVRFDRDQQQIDGASVDDDAPTDLDLLIDAVVAANDQLGYRPPRPVWPEPLGERVALRLAAGAAEDVTPVVGGVQGSTAQIAVADDPRRQRQLPVGWDLERGNLLLLGIPGSGTSTTLASAALTLADAYAPDELDLLVLDLGNRDLAPLADLPHTTAYVGSGSGAREQQVRLLKYLRAELDRRRGGGPQRRMVVLVDGLGVLRDEYDDFDGLKLIEGFYRVYADGPDVGIWTAVATARSKAVPSQLEEVTTQRWLFRLADPYDYSASGVPVRLAPPAVPGRCILAETKLHAHVGTPAGGLAEAVAAVAAHWGNPAAKASVVGRLPTSISVAQLGAPVRLDTEPWHLPVGVRESDLEVAEIDVYEGEHVLIAGPARSGKSTLLLATAENARGAGSTIWAICGRRSPLQQAGLDRCAVGAEEATALLAAARVHRGPLLLLVDDAEQFADDDQAFAGLLSARTTELLVVAAGRSDDLRSLYSHWTKTIRKARCGVLLQPNVDYDGELLGVTLPRRAPVAVTPGRGYLVSGGMVDFLQAMSPTEDADRSVAVGRAT